MPHSRIALSLAGLFTASLTPPSAAQSFRGGDLITANFRPAELWQVAASPGAVPTMLLGPAQLTGPAGVAARRDGSILIADFSGNAILQLDAQGTLTTLAPVPGPLRVVEDDFGDVFATSGASIVRIDLAGTVSTFASGAPLTRPFDVAFDGDGTLLVVDDRVDGLFRVDAAGAVSTIHQGPPFQLPQGVAVAHDGDYVVFDGLADALFRVDRTTGQVSTFVDRATLAENPCGITESFDGGFFVSQSSAATSRIVQVDLNGSVTMIAGGAPFSNLEDVTRVRELRGPIGTATSGSGASRYGFSLEVPAAPGDIYTFALSTSVFPGIPLSLLGDDRAFTTNLDALFRTTALVNAPPILVGWTGALDLNGRAAGTLDLSTSPAGGLTGATLFVSGLVISPSAPTGIVAITNLHRLRF